MVEVVEVVEVVVRWLCGVMVVLESPSLRALGRDARRHGHHGNAQTIATQCPCGQIPDQAGRAGRQF